MSSTDDQGSTQRSYPSPRSLWTPQETALVLIDHQPVMAHGVATIDRQLLVNNVTALAKTAKVFGLPTILTTVNKAFSGPIYKEVEAVFPDAPQYDRTTVNAWEDEATVAAIKKTGRKRLIMAGLWTEICLAFPALNAWEEGYEVQAVLDASGGFSQQAHEAATLRMVEAGIVPTTWITVLSELFRDYARSENYDAVLAIARDHGGSWGAAIDQYIYNAGLEHGQPQPGDALVG